MKSHSAAIDADGRNIVVSSEDASLLQTLSEAFEAVPGLWANPDISVRGFGPYSVSGTGAFDGVNLSRTNVVFRITLVVGAEIRSHVSESRCTMHASTAVVGGKAVCFLGVPGSGKSTLALLLGNQEKYMGDEYAFLDFQAAQVCHPRYPVQIKPGSRMLFPKRLFDRAVAVDGGDLSESFLVPFADIEAYVTSETGKPVGAFVFPHYVSGVLAARVIEPSASDLPRLFFGVRRRPVFKD